MLLCESCGQVEAIDVEEYCHRCGKIVCFECLDGEWCPTCLEGKNENKENKKDQD